MKMRPDVGLSTPVMVLIRVDLPAPLSPIRQTISFLPIARLMFLSACTAPKNFWTSTRRTMWSKAPEDAVTSGTGSAEGIAAASLGRPGMRLHGLGGIRLGAVEEAVHGGPRAG